MDNQLTTTFFATTYSLQQARTRLRNLRSYLIDYFFASSPDLSLRATDPLRQSSSEARGSAAIPEIASSKTPRNDNNILPRNDKKEAGMTIEDPWLTSLGEEFYKQFSKENVYKKLKEIETAIENSNPLIIYIAFDLPEEEVNSLGLWFRSNTPHTVLFDTKIDPNVIGGCAFSWHGVYRDYSLRKKIEENQEKILISLKSFGR